LSWGERQERLELQYDGERLVRTLGQRRCLGQHDRSIDGEIMRVETSSRRLDQNPHQLNCIPRNLAMETFGSATSSAAQFAGWAGDHAPQQSESEDAKAQSSRVGCSTDWRAGQNRVGLSQPRKPPTTHLKVNLGSSTWTFDAYHSRLMPALNSKYKRSTASEACRTYHRKVAADLVWRPT
jgi:hypothetical protein